MDNIRLQKFMADCGVASRRKAEEIILSGKVTVNGLKITELGTKVNNDDIVTVNGKRVKPVFKKIYIILNKPVGYLTTVSDDNSRNTVMNLIEDEIHDRVFPVGRLDFDTEGLLILTNDGDLTYALTHPKHKIVKTYIATLNDVPKPTDVERLKRGVKIDERKTVPDNIDWLKDNVLKISIHEGRNRQIRRMIEAIGYEVKQLKRVSIGNIQLGNIPLGRFRHMTNSEIEYLKGVSEL